MMAKDLISIMTDEKNPAIGGGAASATVIRCPQFTAAVVDNVDDRNRSRLIHNPQPEGSMTATVAGLSTSLSCRRAQIAGRW